MKLAGRGVSTFQGPSRLRYRSEEAAVRPATMNEGKRHRALVEGMFRPVRGEFASVLMVLLMMLVLDVSVGAYVVAGVG